jgi:hypothetical protein
VIELLSETRLGGLAREWFVGSLPALQGCAQIGASVRRIGVFRAAFLAIFVRL